MNQTETIKCNKIRQVAIGDLLDGKHSFFIPSYQRGYRWTKTQIYDLCNDLLEYALKAEPDSKSFYSLQPLIVKKEKRDIRGNGNEEEVYDVIDGQQRLTSIFVLYKALHKVLKGTDSASERSLLDNCRQLYSICYETRKSDMKLLDKLGEGEIYNEDIKNIDAEHIINAYLYILQWLKSADDDYNCAKCTWKKVSTKEYDQQTAATKLFELVNNRKEDIFSAQFIWYEIDPSKDVIQEFLNENKGKIPLTDVEKIRGIFLQRLNKDEKSDEIQRRIAKDWELIENTLHRNDFWSFISNDSNQEDGRISLIFQYLYERDCEDKSYEEADRLFRYYERKFKKSNDPQNEIIEEWKNVMDAFKMLQDWFRNPRVYNYVGLLIREVKEGSTIKDVAYIYKKSETHDSFIKELKQKVWDDILSYIKIEKEYNSDLDVDSYIDLFYKDVKETSEGTQENQEEEDEKNGKKGGKPNKPKKTDNDKIRGLLLFLNVNVLCRQIEKNIEEAKNLPSQNQGRTNYDGMFTIYRFPFDAFADDKWDVEHVDSNTTNLLNTNKDRDEWIEAALESFGNGLNIEPSVTKWRKAVNGKDNENAETLWNDIVAKIKEWDDEENNESDQAKNWIGNLVLLDHKSNRGYGNDVFRQKRNKLRVKIQNGVFVPVVTQNVFEKRYSNKPTYVMRWSLDDKKSYHEYMLNEIDEFKNDIKSENNHKK